MRDFSQPGRSSVHSPYGMAATSHPLSTQVALDILKAGGNALDAAIAACAVQCVVEPGSTGIGGDCFCLYAQEGSAADIIGYNGSGRSPNGLSAKYLKERGIHKIERHSPHAVIIPGAVDAWCQLNNDHGKLPLKTLLNPAIDYAEGGYPISPRVQYDFASQLDHLKRDPDCAKIFLMDGRVPHVGEMHHQKALAQSLRKIGDQGRDAFYEGQIASQLVEKLQSLGGVHSLTDFSQARGEYITPISTDFRGHQVYQCPPNGQGLTALQLLNIMEGYPPIFSDASNNLTKPLHIGRIHQELEACRQAYGARNLYLADPQKSDMPIDKLLSKDYAEQIRTHLKPDQSMTTLAENGQPIYGQESEGGGTHKDTVYITVIDKDRNACSFINTLFWSFGTGITEGRSGIVLTNRGQGFNLIEGHPNALQGGKRPLHTIIPALMSREGRIMSSFGVMGGEYQAFGQMQFLTRLLDYGLDIQEAMDCPRFMVNPFTGVVELEGALMSNTELCEGLTKLGHVLSLAATPIGGSQAISIDWQQNALSGGSDPRKDGCAIGY